MQGRGQQCCSRSLSAGIQSQENRLTWKAKALMPATAVSCSRAAPAPVQEHKCPQGSTRRSHCLSADLRLADVSSRGKGPVDVSSVLRPEGTPLAHMPDCHIGAGAHEDARTRAYVSRHLPPRHDKVGAGHSHRSAAEACLASSAGARRARPAACPRRRRAGSPASARCTGSWPCVMEQAAVTARSVWRSLSGLL